jgi:ATP-dependent Clp protease ATP-binding subunit ClpA
LLFDEIEKAFSGKYGHQGSELMGILMKMLDQGELVNHWDESKPVSFRKTVIIFTSNIGARKIAETGKTKIGFFQRRSGNHLTDEEVQKLNDIIYESTKGDFEEFFPPELRNRMDRLIVFRFLTRSEFLIILETIEIPRLRRQFEERHGILVEVAPSVIEWLLSYGVVREEGVRSLHRAILRKIVNPLATYLNAGLLKKSDQIVVEVDNPKEEESHFRFFNTREE